MILKTNEDTYKDDKSAINRDTLALSELMQSRGWKLVGNSIDLLLEQYRDELENSKDAEEIWKLQYGTQNLRALKKIPEDLIKEISTYDVSSESPPKEHLEFDYKD